MGSCERRSKFYQALAEDLIVFAEHHFKRSRRAPDGATEGDHVASAAAQWKLLGRKPKALAAVEVRPPFPEALTYLWRWFAEISLGISANGMGVANISWEALSAWSALMGVRLEPWEALTIARLGSLRASIFSEPESSADGGQNAN